MAERVEIARPLCDFCARPVATQVDFDATSEGDRPDLCWGAFDDQECENGRIEDGGWRARAEKAEFEVAALEAELAAAREALKRISRWDNEQALIARAALSGETPGG